MVAVVPQKKETSQNTTEDFVFYVMVRIDENNTNFHRREIGLCDLNKLDDVTKQNIIAAIEKRNQKDPSNQGSVDPNDWKVYLHGNAQEIAAASPCFCPTPSVVVDVRRASLNSLGVP